MATNTKAAAKSTATAAKSDETPETVTPAAAPAPATSGLGFELKATRAAVAEIKRAAPKRVKEENPTEEAVKHSRETGDVLAFPGLPNEEAVKKVTGLLRRAANDADHGIQLQTVKDGDTWTINFKAIDKKRDRKYTADDIRKWANENGKGDFAGKKIPNEVRDEFKKANGFDKKTKKTAAK